MSTLAKIYSDWIYNQGVYELHIFDSVYQIWVCAEVFDNGSEIYLWQIQYSNDSVSSLTLPDGKDESLEVAQSQAENELIELGYRKITEQEQNLL